MPLIADTPVRNDRIEELGENVSVVKGDGEHPLAGPHFRKYI